MRSVLTHPGALSLEQLANQLQEQQATKLDYVADTRRVGFHVDEGEFSVTLDGIDGEFGVNKLAHEHIGGFAGIPKRYYDRMKGDAPALLKSNVDHWLNQEPGKRMFRTLQGDLRAVLSDRFRRLDNFDLAQHLLPEFATVDGLEFMISALTPERMYIRATLPRLQAEIKKGDIVQAGVEISNSEVGSGALTVRPYLLRLICLNGMTAGYDLRKYHAGSRVDESTNAILSDATREQEDKVIFMMAADMVRAALTDVRFNEIVDQLKEIATGEPVERPVAAVETLGKQLDLNETERGSVLQFLSTGGDLSQWGMVNALTETAKDADSFDRLVELEALAGQLAAMEARDWHRVAVAA